MTRNRIVPGPRRCGGGPRLACGLALAILLAAAAWRLGPCRGPGPDAERPPGPVAMTYEPPRAALARFEGRIQAGMVARLSGVDATLTVTAPVSDAGVAMLGPLPPATRARLELLSRDGGVVGAPLAVVTPEVSRLSSFLILPAEDSALVVFRKPRAEFVRVEVGAWGESAPLKARASGTAELRFHYLFEKLRPDTDHFVRVRGPAWDLVTDFRFRTLRAGAWSATSSVLKRLETEPGQTEFLLEILVQSPDLRAVPALSRLVSRLAPDRVEALRRIARFACIVRSRELADRLEPLVEKVTDDELRDGLVMALEESDHPRAPELGLKYVDRAASGRGMPGCGLAVALRHDAASCERLAHAFKKNPRAVQLAQSMAECDPDRARQLFTQWLQPSQPLDVAIVPGTLLGLAELGGEPDVAVMAGCLDARWPAAIHALAAEALVAQSGPAARKALVAALDKQPDDRALIWAVARLGLATTVPVLVRRLHDSKDPDVRRDAAVGLGLLRSPASFEPLTAALADASPDVVAAAAWALGTAGDANATGSLLRVVQSAADEQGLAAWALGSLGVVWTAGSLRAQLERLAATPDPPPGRVAMLAWALGRLARQSRLGQLEHGERPGLEELESSDSWAGRGAVKLLEGLVGKEETPPIVRKILRRAIFDVTDGTDDLSWPGSFSPPAGARQPGHEPSAPPPLDPVGTQRLGGQTTLHILHPVSLWHRTGVWLRRGESVDVTGLGFYARVRDGPVVRAAGRGEVDAQECPELELAAVHGGRRYSLKLENQRILAERDGELLLTLCGHSSNGCVSCLPNGNLVGMAWVLVER